MNITYLRVTIVPDGPWRVGALGKNRSALETATDPDGNVILPASSLAGSFHAHLGDQAKNGVMGRIFRAKPDGDELIGASDLWFLGVALDGEESLPVEATTRTATAINRHRKAARNGGSHDVHEVYNTAKIRLYLRYEGAVEGVLAQLKAWPVTIGGGLSTGLGEARITEIKHRTLDMTNASDVLARVELGGSGPTALDTLLAAGQAKTVRVTAEPGKLAIEATLRIDKVLLPTSSQNEQPKPVDYWLQGTRWKGIIRSRVEYIGRSLGMRVCGDTDDQWHGCGKCAVCEVFGSGDTGVSRLVFSFSKLANESPSKRARNAIDRFTGGVQDQKLFPEQTISPTGVSLSVRELKPLEERHTWVAKALLLTLRDINDGYVGVGGRTATGLGKVTFSSIALDGSIKELTGEPKGLAEVTGISDADLQADGRFMKEATNA